MEPFLHSVEWFHSHPGRWAVHVLFSGRRRCHVVHRRGAGVGQHGRPWHGGGAEPVVVEWGLPPTASEHATKRRRPRLATGR